MTVSTCGRLVPKPHEGVLTSRIPALQTSKDGVCSVQSLLPCSCRDLLPSMHCFPRLHKHLGVPRHLLLEANNTCSILSHQSNDPAYESNLAAHV